MVSRKRLCKYCGRPSTEPPMSYRENPFCDTCLPERLAKAQTQTGPFRIEREGRYFTFVPECE